MQRVMIIGGSGSGKSTLARALGAATGLPVVHIDPMYWAPGWVQRPKEETRLLIDAAIAQEHWVFEGNHTSSFPERMQRADTLVFLDLPTWRRFPRVLWRTLRYHGKTRPDLTEGCPERFDPGFLFGWVLRYRFDGRRRALAAIAAAPGHLRVVQLGSPRDVNAFLKEVERD